VPNYNTSAPSTFDRCERGSCYHDLARGVLVEDELLDRDGPYPDNLTLIRGAVSPEVLPPLT
jgi:hypothetical protein